MTDFSSIRSSVFVQAAYQEAKDTKAAADTVAKPGGGFSDLVAKGASEAVETVRTGDAAALAGLTGKAGMQQVVEATMAMESTVQISVALRDKLVEAYQEVIRMPI